MMKFLLRILSLVLCLLAFTSVTGWAQDNNWQLFKQRFITPDGRVIDTDNQGISHSEGQGYGMLLAVFNHDPVIFQQLWFWTEKTLQHPHSGLFSWRYEPGVKRVTDTNDASDGDTLIGWALLLAGQQWHNQTWIRASAKIQQAILGKLIIEQNSNSLLLPGLQGFEKADGYIINPSYFIFPAWMSFWDYSHDPAWLRLRESSLRLLAKMRFGSYQLPCDWVFIDHAGNMSPAPGWPARFSYNAIRIPLYLLWGKSGAESVAVFRQYWSHYSRDATPAWVNVNTGAFADYFLSGGGLAIRDLTLTQNNANTLEPQLSDGEGYYSAVLHMLALRVAH